jgi:hypothetical protein
MGEDRQGLPFSYWKSKEGMKRLNLLYHLQKKTLKELALLVGCHFSTIWDWFKKQGIPLRTVSQAMQGPLNKRWGQKHSPATIEKMQRAQSGKVISERQRRILSLARKGKYLREEAFRWKGGRYINDSGYVMIFKPEHSRAAQNGYVREHILVAEKVLGHDLPESAVIHHWGRKDINLNGNLVICQDRNYHNLIERRMRERGLTRSLREQAMTNEPSQEVTGNI